MYACLLFVIYWSLNGYSIRRSFLSRILGFWHARYWSQTSFVFVKFDLINSITLFFIYCGFRNPFSISFYLIRIWKVYQNIEVHRLHGSWWLMNNLCIILDWKEFEIKRCEIYLFFTQIIYEMQLHSISVIKKCSQLHLFSSQDPNFQNKSRHALISS